MGNSRRATRRNTDLVDRRGRANFTNGRANWYILLCVLKILRRHTLVANRAHLHAEISKQRASKLGLFTSILGHVGDGNFHQIVMYDPADPEQQKAVENCVNTMMIDALEMEGTVSVRNPLWSHLTNPLFADMYLPGRAWHWSW